MKNFPVSKIYICGFMGAGKSTLIKKLNIMKSEWKFIDLDEYIWNRFIKRPEQSQNDYTQKQLADWINEKGRNFFHQKELECLHEISSKNENSKFVLALAGNTLDIETIRIIKKDYKSRLVWLDTPFSECIARVEKRMNKKFPQDAISFFKKLHSDWSEHYIKADVRLNLEQQQSINNIHFLLNL